MESHLLQMRGLKPETMKYFCMTEAMSHLLQMRGLKPDFLNGFKQIGSHLLQMRGLKHKLIN